jgi:hypothetical protein
MKLSISDFVAELGGGTGRLLWEPSGVCEREGDEGTEPADWLLT